MGRADFIMIDHRTYRRRTDFPSYDDRPFRRLLVTAHVKKHAKWVRAHKKANNQRVR